MIEKLQFCMQACFNYKTLNIFVLYELFAVNGATSCGIQLETPLNDPSERYLQRKIIQKILGKYISISGTKPD